MVMMVVMVNRRRRRGKFGESSGHATIRRIPFLPFPPLRARAHRYQPVPLSLNLTYPNPMQRRKPRATLLFLFLFLFLSRYSVFLYFLLSIFIASRFWFIPFRVSLSFFLFFFSRVRYPSLITLPFLPHYITVSLHVASRSYPYDILVGDGSPVGGIIDLAWRYILVVLCAPRYAHPRTERAREKRDT